MKVIPIFAHAGITGFESPAEEYTQLALDLDQLLIDHPCATFLGYACGDSMQDVGIFDKDLLIVDRSLDVQDFDIIVANLNGAYFGAFRSVISGLSDHPFRFKPITDSAIIRSLLA